MKKCAVCNNVDGLKTYFVREMMFGFRDEFEYFHCSKCNCLQIAEIPENIQDYYPDNYYSFQKPELKKLGYLRKKRDTYALFGKGLTGKLLNLYLPGTKLEILAEAHIHENSKILDVGSGNGKLLLELNQIGLQNLLGVDPYVENDIELVNGIKILKKTIHEITGQYDLIMFHHSFEHMSDPRETLNTVSRLLSSKGYCIIRVPTTSSYAWKHYKENWVQLDAPRHFFLHSVDSMKILAEENNLVIEKVIYDSTAFQFWGSEQNAHDIPLKGERSYAINPEKSIFSKEEINQYKEKAKELNKAGQGDACAFILRHKK